jgi:ligand-binding SRPBCC domain-containing protein
MTTYQRTVWIDAPLEQVWAFHSTIAGLQALTPGFLGLRVEAIRGDTDGTLVEGSEIDLRMRPLGLLPPTAWTSVITDREASSQRCWFIDVMRGGPFDYWQHVHTFEAIDGGTQIDDLVTVRLGGPLAPLVSPAAVIGLAPMFRYRHRQTRTQLE